MNGKFPAKFLCCRERQALPFYMDESHHYDLAVQKTRSGCHILKRICIGNVQFVQQERTFFASAAVITLQISAENLTYSFGAVLNGKKHSFGENHTKYLPTEVADGFTGVLIGLYVQSTDARDCSQSSVFRGLSCDYAEGKLF